VSVGADDGLSAPDPVQVREHVQAIQGRIAETVGLGAGVYLVVCGVLAFVSWEATWGGSSQPWRVGITINFGDAAAILGVLGGLVVAINIIVWGWHATGRSDPRVYAHAQAMARAAVAVGQGAIFVGIGLVLSYSAAEFDVPRLSSGLIAVALIVMISVHTAEGLNDGTNLEWQIYRAGVRADAARLGRVLDRWNVLGSNENRIIIRVVRDNGISAVLLAIPVIAVLFVRGENGRLFDISMIECIAACLAALALTVCAFVIVVGTARSFVVKDFFSMAQYVMVGAFVYLTGALSVLSVALGEQTVLWQILLGLALLFLLGGALARPISGLRRTHDHWLFGHSARLVVRRSVRMQLVRKLRVLGEPAPGRPTPRLGRRQKVIDWYHSATGSPT
jgi:hypothetical protein